MVNYIFSFLKCSELDCFKPALLDLNKPDWLFDLQLFIEELKTNFGTHNSVDKAEAKLKGLCMQENHKTTKYFIKFKQLATHIQCVRTRCWGYQCSSGFGRRLQLMHCAYLLTLSEYFGVSRTFGVWVKSDTSLRQVVENEARRGSAYRWLKSCGRGNKLLK